MLHYSAYGNIFIGFEIYVSLAFRRLVRVRIDAGYILLLSAFPHCGATSCYEAMVV
jgi:hypothetical protein